MGKRIRLEIVATLSDGAQDTFGEEGSINPRVENTQNFGKETTSMHNYFLPLRPAVEDAEIQVH